ncbi:MULTISPECIES: hypothetical protein [unclassified Amycolatopsis]|uniref:hypothetical protein n=1 Tax=unclassified Amycolatopsis TaxID=2618356 RepID=UPI00287B9AFB|nr:MULTISPECIES: hypothetical protein [unclassified Amycolatopsis]
MADDLAGAGAGAGEPPEIAGEPEAGHGVVVAAQQPGERGQAVFADHLGPALRARFARQVGEHLAALVVDAQHPGRGRKADVLQVPEQRVNRTADGVADADDPAVRLVLEHFLGRHPPASGCGQKWSSPPSANTPFTLGP